MIRFIMIELNYSDLNSIFNMSIIYLRLIILSVVDDVSVDSETFFD
jgi:hypothetical protein